MKLKTFSVLVEDEKGANALELSLLLPVIMLAIFGSAELLMQIYVRSHIHHFARQAARDSIVGAAQLSTIENTLRKKIEILPGLKDGEDLVISICQQNGCGTTTSAISELTGDTNSNGVCDAGETFTDFNRNGAPEKVGDTISGNSLGGPNDPVIIAIQAEAGNFFGSLALSDQLTKVHDINVRAVGINEDFASPVINCP
jgi:Flp pilus assembly pilin Flp